jgi:CBS domain-containing protein
VAALHAAGGRLTVSEAMETAYPVAAESEGVIAVRDRMRLLGWAALPVTAGGRYRGVVTLEALERALR